VRDPTRLGWIDLEMTGLEPEQHVIIEIATLVTDRDLNILAEGPVLAVRRSDEELARMNDWNVNTHTASGLVERIRASQIDVQEAERQTLAFLEAWIPRGVSPLCGNSISQDRRFLRREMPALDAFFHYRQIDVSTVKELVRRWYSDRYQPPAKREVHRAIDDVRESVNELRWYREHVFQPANGASRPSPAARLGAALMAPARRLARSLRRGG
jgi:oligoribonuclease